MGPGSGIHYHMLARSCSMSSWRRASTLALIAPPACTVIQVTLDWGGKYAANSAGLVRGMPIWSFGSASLSMPTIPVYSLAERILPRPTLIYRMQLRANFHRYTKSPT
jgi:hypothetical protein